MTVLHCGHRPTSLEVAIAQARTERASPSAPHCRPGCHGPRHSKHVLWPHAPHWLRFPWRLRTAASSPLRCSTLTPTPSTEHSTCITPHQVNPCPASTAPAQTTATLTAALRLGSAKRAGSASVKPRVWRPHAGFWHQRTVGSASILRPSTSRQYLSVPIAATRQRQ
eukprot:3139217-Rhodomonas_salina.1